MKDRKDRKERRYNMHRISFKSALIFCQKDDCDFYEESIFDIEKARKRVKYHVQKTGHDVKFLITKHIRYSLQEGSDV